MPISFPSSPTLNQTYTYIDHTWKWNGTVWQSVGTLQGTQGTQGLQGIQGTQGIQGMQGTTGIQGTQGLQGLQGNQGTIGIQGTGGNTPTDQIISTFLMGGL